MVAVFVALAWFTLTTPPPEPDPSTYMPGATACWVEDKADGTAERICGDVRKAPKGAHSFADTIPNEDEPAFDCRADGNQQCAPGAAIQGEYI